MKTFEEVWKLIFVLEQMDLQANFSVTGDEIEAWFNCNDVFLPAADSEDFDHTDIPAIEAAFNALDATEEVGNTAYTEMLFIARRRQTPPQERILSQLPEDVQSLFRAVKGE